MKKILLLMTTLLVCVSCGINQSNNLTNSEEVLMERAQAEGWNVCTFYPQYVEDMLCKQTELEEYIYWIEYNDIDVNFDYDIISMSKETFYLLQEMLDKLSGTELYTKEWKDIRKEYSFIILYKGETNILISSKDL